MNIQRLNVINAEGSGNLLPHNIGGYITRLENEGAEAIVILTDLDEDICVNKTKERISARKQDIVVIAVKKIEAWFLACNPAMQNLLADPAFNFPSPENENAPFETINNLLINHTGRGVGKKRAGKIRLVTRLLEKGLDLTQAAAHPNCPSVNYLVHKLTLLGGGQQQKALPKQSSASTEAEAGPDGSKG